MFISISRLGSRLFLQGPYFTFKHQSMTYIMRYKEFKSQSDGWLPPLSLNLSSMLNYLGKVPVLPHGTKWLYEGSRYMFLSRFSMKITVYISDWVFQTWISFSTCFSLHGTANYSRRTHLEAELRISSTCCYLVPLFWLRSFLLVGWCLMCQHFLWA